MSRGTILQDSDGEILRPSFPDIPATSPFRPYTEISYGLPFDRAAAKHLSGSGLLNCSRVYIIASKSLASQTDKLKRLETALGDRHVGSWLGIPAHTPWDTLVPIMRDMREKEADCLITLGGGSLADGAKAVVYLLENNVHTTSDITALSQHFLDTRHAIEHPYGNAPKIPLILMPTTLSGAEFSKYAGITNPTSHMKVQFTHARMYASLIVLDSALCLTTPDSVWRSTGVRAIDHCVENICSSNADPASDAASERGLMRMVKSLLAYAKDSEDLEARLESLLATNEAMTGLTLLVLCGASHGIGHNLGPLGVGHGETSCILLPAVMKYNARVNAGQQEVVQRILWDEPEIAEVLSKHGLRRDASDTGDALRAIFDELGMPRDLKQFGIGRDKWDQLAKNSLADAMVQQNPIPMTKPEQVIEVLEMVSGEDE